MTKFKKEFFIHNRDRLSKVLPRSYVILTSSAVLQQSADLSYPYRQDSNFWYLTGINRPDFYCGIDTQSGETTLFYREQNDYQIEWDGELSFASLKRTSGMTNFEPQQKIADYIKQAQTNKLTLCSLLPPAERVEPYGFYANPARQLLTHVLEGYGVTEFKDIRVELARLRQIKQTVELDAIKRAIAATATVLDEVKQRLDTFETEKQIENAISSGFYAQGAGGHAYSPIVAFGKNASVIHYNENNDTIGAQGLLLLDVGAQVDGYASDISRTWSVGKPTKRQQDVYNAVLALQNDAMGLLKPGVYLKEYQEKIEKQAAKALQDLGKEPRQYPHGISHFLGLDVHDAGDYAASIAPGMVLTVEPGLYFADESIGVRIEDDVLVTEKGIENLSERISKLL